MLIFCVLLDQLLSHIIFGQLYYYKYTLVKKYNKPLQKRETKVFKQKKIIKDLFKVQEQKNSSVLKLNIKLDLNF